jgi:isopenicillin N synthase-like dioxygenase
VGFYVLQGHNLPQDLIASGFDLAHRFFALSAAAKQKITMDRAGWPLGGVGYLPHGERKLPRRTEGNLNEAFLAKLGSGIELDDNQWPDSTAVAGMSQFVGQYAAAMASLVRSLLPVYATALELDPAFFDAAFTTPFCRFRMTHYPPIGEASAATYSIAPHVDSTFITILAQDSTGLTVHSPRSGGWIEIPPIGAGLVVNTGELLKQWSNERFISVRHFVRHSGHRERYSIPFFVNANADYVMECLPTCQGPGNPPKYPPISYLQSQAVALGE